MNRIFIQARFFCKHPDTQSAVFRHHSSHHFTFWSFVNEIVLPERESSLTFSRPSLKALCHLKIIVLDRVASPWAAIKEANNSVAGLLSFTQNLIAYHCSIFSCIAKTRPYTNSSSARLAQPIQLKQVWSLCQGHYQRTDTHQQGATLPIHT